MAEKFLSEYEIKYDYIPHTGGNISREVLKEELKKSPGLGIAVFAWATDENGKYVRPPNKQDTHFTLLVAVEENDALYVWDSYPPYLKRLDYNFEISFAMRFYLRKKTEAEKKAEEKQKSIMELIIEKLKLVVQLFKELLLKKAITETKNPDPLPDVPKDEKTANLPNNSPNLPTYEWDTKPQARLSVRRIADEYKIGWDEKNLLCAVIEAESNFDIKATHKNKNGTTDWGIAMFNDGKNESGVPFWIGEGADFVSGQECLENPEKCIRVFIREYKKGNLKYWSAFKNGSYKQFMV